MEREDEVRLIKDFIAGDEMAFNKIATKYQRKIYWHARRILDNHLDADEVTQEVLIVIYKKLKTFNLNSSLYTWIYRITATRCLNYIKKRKFKKMLYLDDSEVKDIEAREDIVQGIENKNKVEKLKALLEHLPAKQKEVFILRHFEELSYEEISEITGKSIGGLKANYFHALKKVMEKMQ